MIRESLHIRRFEPGDGEDVRRLHEAALREVGAFIEDPELDEDLLDIEASYLGSGEFLIGELEGRMVAMGALRRTGPDLAEVKRMRVEPAYQGRGYGQNILTTLEKRAADLGYRNLHLDTAVHLEAARHLYERNGYREMRRGKIGSLDCVFYEKNLV